MDVRQVEMTIRNEIISHGDRCCHFGINGIRWYLDRSFQTRVCQQRWIFRMRDLLLQARLLVLDAKVSGERISG
ncbi:MAG: hypothetical protein MK103_10275 [Planctomycetes bacterium]|nr:hypothetical protein [Planctomycetota bacterium]